MKLCVFILALSFHLVSLSQEIADTAKVRAKDTIHSPKKAAFFSAVLPGSGQIYNHLAMPKGKKNAYWKVPLIYVALGGTGYTVLANNRLQRELKNEYKTRLAGNPGLPEYETYDLDGIEQLYNKHLNRRDLFILGFGAVYLLQVVDAAVEAHFVHFDISEDLSLSLQPAYFSSGQAGVTLNLDFR